MVKGWYRTRVLWGTGVIIFSLSVVLRGGDRDGRTSVYRVSELEAQVAVCFVLDQLDLTQAQMKTLLDCRAKYALYAEKQLDNLRDWVANNEPWDRYDELVALDKWPDEKLAWSLQKQHQISTCLPRAANNAMNDIVSKAFTPQLSQKQRACLVALGKERFVGKQNVAASRAPEDLQSEDLSPEKRAMILHDLGLVGMPSRVAKLVMAPYLEEALVRRFKPGVADMPYVPQFDRNKASRFPAVWDFKLNAEVPLRDRYFAAATAKLGARITNDQALEICQVLEKYLKRVDTSGRVTDYGDWRAGRKYVRELERKAERALRGRVIDWEDMKELLELRDDLSEAVSERHGKSGKRAAENARNAIKDILTAGQLEFLVTTTICPVPYGSEHGSTRAGQVSHAGDSHLAEILSEIRGIRNWEGRESKSMRVRYVKKICNGAIYDRLPKREREQAYSRAYASIMEIVEEAKSLSDRDFLLNRDKLVDRLKELDIHGAPIRMGMQRTTQNMERAINAKIDRLFIGNNMLILCRKQLQVHTAGETSKYR